MKNKKYWVLAAILGICASVIWAVDNTESQISTQFTYPKDTLKGLQGVKVLVEAIKPEVEKYGLTEQQLQTDVELRLRQNGIKVLSEKEWLSAAGQPYIYVNVNIMKVENIPLVTYGITLELKQNVSLERDPTKLCSASTWDRRGVMSAGLGKIENIRECVKGYVDNFINDYLAANPKDEQKQ